MDEFACATLGDARRSRRLTQIAAAVARRSAGRVCDVFATAAERQAAYDFLEHDSVEVEGVRRALFEATARRCAKHDCVYVVLDGTSLTLTDKAKTKGFGSIGSHMLGRRGLKVLNTLALSPTGVPLGVPAQVWWSRVEAVKRGHRRPEDRESVHWRRAATDAFESLRPLAPSTDVHFLADREGDASELLLQLLDAGHAFTIRSSAKRSVLVKGEIRDLRTELLRAAPRAVMYVDIPATSRRSARRAKLRIRAERVTVSMRDHHMKRRRWAELNVVWAREEGTCGANDTPLDWVLFTNTAVSARPDARAAISRYALRWRIEDFHRTWKNGHCHVEETQLRTTNAVVKWATIHAAVAARAERLRRRAREAPLEPASVELSGDEIEALLLIKRREKKRTETIPDAGVPSLGDAVRWIADLGGYVGNRSSGLPGATTIARGLERVAVTVEILATLRKVGKLR